MQINFEAPPAAPKNGTAAENGRYIASLYQYLLKLSAGLNRALKNIDDSNITRVSVSKLSGSIPTDALDGTISTDMLTGTIPTAMLTGTIPASMVEADE